MDVRPALAAAFPRHEQTFPTLTPQEIARMRRFGETRTYQHGERLFETGKPGPGMFVVLSGHVAITQRDGLGHVTPVIDQGPGQFLAEIGQLSGRVALVDGHAEGDVETLLIPPERLRALLVAEADLGERIMRALILRRVSLIQGGVGGPVLIGPSNSSGVIRLQGFLTRNGFPHHLLDPERDHDAAELIARYSPSPSDWPLVVAVDGTVLRNPSETELARALGMIGGPAEDKIYDAAVVGCGPAGLVDRGVCGLGRSFGGRAATCARSAGRPAPARASRIISASPPESPGQALAGRAFNQAQKFGADMMIPVAVKALDCARDRRRLCADARRRRDACARASVVVASGARYRRPEIENLDRFRRPRRLVLGVADRGAAVRRTGSRACRRRQFRGPGSGVSVGSCPQGSHGDPRRRPRRQHVALSDRAYRGHAEYRTGVQHRGGRA